MHQRRVQLEKRIHERGYSGFREILALGDSVLVLRLWPQGIAVLDVTDSHNPREMEPMDPRSRYRGAQVAGNLLYRRWDKHVDIYDRSNADKHLSSVRIAPPYLEYQGGAVLSEGFIYMLARERWSGGGMSDPGHRLLAFRSEVLQ